MADLGNISSPFLIWFCFVQMLCGLEGGLFRWILSGHRGEALQQRVIIQGAEEANSRAKRMAMDIGRLKLTPFFSTFVGTRLTKFNLSIQNSF
jgi:hypothetical protein